MNKPGNMPVDKWTPRAIGVTYSMMACSIANIPMAAKYDDWFWVFLYFVMVSPCSILIAICSNRFDKRVKSHLGTVCTLFVLCLFAGCQQPVREPATDCVTRNEWSAMDQRVTDLENLVKQPTEVLPEPGGSEPNPTPAKPCPKK